MDYNKTPIYRKPVSVANDPKYSLPHWDLAQDGFDAKDYRKALVNLLNFLNPEMLKEVDSDGDFEIRRNHGSAEVRMLLKGDQFKIFAPFIRIGKANKVALMRRALEINFTPLTLAQIRFKDDIMWFEYRTSLELCQPNKVYDVIREICLLCDDYDDEFIDKYNASFYQRPKVSWLPPAEQEEVWQHFQEIAEQYETYIEHFEQKRADKFTWSIIVISMLNIANMPSLNGLLRSDLDREIAIMSNLDLDGRYRIDSGKNFLRKLFKDTSKEDFLNNIYAADKLISVRARSSSQILQNVFAQCSEDIATNLNSGNYYDAAFSMHLMMLRVMYDFNLDDGHVQEITKALEQSSEKEAPIAADILQVVYSKFLSGEVTAEKPKSQGFFSKLFA